MNRIRELRLKKGWKQADLAKELNVSTMAVSYYEREIHQLDPETIHTLCEIFNVSSDYLLGRSDVPKAETAAQKDDGQRAMEREWAAAWAAATPAARAAALAVLMLGAQPPADPAAPTSDG